MKRRTHEAAAELGLYPLNFMLYLARLGAPLDEVWPEISDEWIQAVRGLDWKKFRRPSDERRPENPQVDATGRAVSVQTMSDGAAQLVEKLWRKRYWGEKAVS